MFNIESLDKNKTYSGVTWEDSPPLFSPVWWIQFAGSSAARKIGRAVKMEDVPSHSFALVYEDFDWYVYESHFNTKGVHRIKFWIWISELESGTSIQVFEDEMNVYELRKYTSDFGKKAPYGTFDIIGFIISYFKRRPSLIHKVDKGLFCTEYIGKCQFKSILEHFPSLKYIYELMPVHHWIALTERRNVTLGRHYL
jgi:hypothetical protein